MDTNDLFDFYECAKKGYEVLSKEGKIDKMPDFINKTFDELSDENKINNFLKETLTQKDNNGTLVLLNDDEVGYLLNVVFASLDKYNQRTVNILPIRISKEKYDLLEKWMKK